MKTTHTIVSVIIAMCLLAFASVVRAQTPTTPAPVQSLPAALQPLTGSAELLADQLLKLKSQSISVWLNSSAQVGPSKEEKTFLTGMATEPAIAQAVTALGLTIKLSSPEQINMSVQVRTSDYKVSIYGYDSKTPVPDRGVYTLQPFKLRLRVDGTPKIAYPGAESVKLTIYDVAGRVVDYRYLNMVDGGFEFPAEAAGQGSLEIVKSDKKVEVWDLRKGGAGVNVQGLSLIADVGIENVETIVDKTELNLIPETSGGIGRNVLGQIILTKTTTVSVAGRTLENVPAARFKVRKVTPVVTDYQIIGANTNGIATIVLDAGQYDVIPVFDRGLTEPAYQFPGNGKG